MKAEEETKGETIVGLGGEALRPLGMDIIYLFQINVLSFWVYLGRSSLSILLYWLLDESEEDEGETEESETSTLEQARFDWAHIWMEEGAFHFD